jgi:general secretion pathway protein K
MKGQTHYHSIRIIRSQKGLALVLAVFLVALMMWIATEVTYEASLEYQIHAQAINRTKAYYAAVAGIELGLLRLQLFQRFKQQFANNPAVPKDLLNMIWSFPINWPPPSSTPSGFTDFQNPAEESLMDANFVLLIQDEGSKIDINDLDSPSEVIRNTTRKQILQILTSREENDPDFRSRNPNFRAEEFLNNLTDWIDADRESRNGGSEGQYYSMMRGLPKSEIFPPNRFFRTIGEITQVAGVTPEVFSILSPLITVFGTKAINPNTANPEVLKAIHSSITNEVIAKFEERKSQPGQSFVNADQFWNFLNSEGGARVPTEVQQNTPLVFDDILSFKMTSTGRVGNNFRKIEVVVYDLQGAISRVSRRVREQRQGAAPPASGTSGAGSGAVDSSGGAELLSRPLQIVYWLED